MVILIKPIWTALLINVFFMIYFISDGHVTRGCIKDLSDSELNACDKNTNCNICLDTNCNNEFVNSATKVTISFVLIISIISTLLSL